VVVGVVPPVAVVGAGVPVVEVGLVAVGEGVGLGAVVVVVLVGGGVVVAPPVVVVVTIPAKRLLKS